MRAYHARAIAAWLRSVAAHYRSASTTTRIREQLEERFRGGVPMPRTACELAEVIGACVDVAVSDLATEVESASGRWEA